MKLIYYSTFRYKDFHITLLPKQLEEIPGRIASGRKKKNHKIKIN